jgi:hypothetical protein
METLSDIRREEQQRIDRARTFERLTNEAVKLRSAVAEPVTLTDEDALTKILDLVGAVPASILTRGSGFIHGGYSSRDVIMQAAVDALAESRRRNTERTDAHKKAKARLKVVEAELKAFE